MIDYSKPILDENNEPIKIAEIADHHCIRCIKKARAFKKIGYEIYGVGTRDVYGNDIYDAFMVYHNETQFKNIIKLLIEKGVREITWNNEPDTQVSWIRDVVTDMNMQDKVKIVTDLHDLDSVRRGIIPIPERKMFNDSDALIYVSNPIQTITNELHKVDKPNTVIYSYCNKGIVSWDEKDIPNRKGLVYEGGANPPEDTEMNTIFSYRSLYGIMKRLVELGNETYMYCGNVSAFKTYQDIGAVVFPPTEYEKMMNELVRYKYGILIFNNADGQKNQVNHTLTNKFFEYTAAGLPSLACWCPESMKLVEKWGVGFTFNHIDEIGNCSQLEDQYMEKMENIKTFNSKVYMENFIGKLELLYAGLLGLEKKHIPDNIKELWEFEYGKEETAKLLK